MLKRVSVLMLLIAMVAGSPARATVAACFDGDDSVYPLSDPSYGTGRYSLPAADPAFLVVVSHGYSHHSASHVQHMRRIADAGAATFAMDNRGTYVDGAGNIRGWRVKEGAQDAITVAQAFLAACPSIETVIIQGVSMGGNTSGLAIAAGATKTDGISPLFDYWVAVEPAANVTETYLEATAVAPANAFAALAKADIEEEFGGTLAEQPAEYLNGTVVARVNDIAASGLSGAFVVHGFDDGLVPYNQGRELTAALRARGVATEFHNVARRGNASGNADHEGGTTLTENAGKPLWSGLGLGQYPEPLAGHGTESSQTHIVIQAGLQIVLDLVSAGRTHQGHAEYLVDGELGSIRLA